MRFNSLLVNAGMNGLAQGLGKLVRFIITSIVIAKFGAASWGEVAFALTLVTYLNFVLDFGLSSLALIERPDDEKMDRKLFVALGYTRAILIFVFAIIGLVVFWKMDFAGGFVLKLYLLQLCLRPFCLDWWLSRKGYAGITPLVQFVRQMLVLAAVWFLGLSSIEGFVILDVSSELLATVALWFVGPRRHFSVGFPSRGEWADAWGCYKGSFILFVSYSLLLLHQNVDIFFLKFFAGNASVGVYDYCYRYALFVFMLGGALSIPLRRQLARLKEFKDILGRRVLVLSCHKILGVMSASFLVGTMALADVFFVKIIPIGIDFPAAKALVLFACWLVIAFYSVPWGEWLISESRKDYLKLAIVAGVVNVITNTFLVPTYGILGAAFAKICSEFSIFVFLLFKIEPEMRKQFVKVVWLHILLLPSVIVFFRTGILPMWLLGTTVAVELVVLFAFRYLTKKDFKVLAKN